MILPTSYIGNVEYFWIIANTKEITIDHSEPYQKQTYRNRCTILSANGIQDLTVPVEKPFGNKTKVNDLLISYAEDWQKNHIKSIESAYRRTPFYEYYSDLIFEIINKKHQKLIDLNKELTAHLTDKLGIICEIKYSQNEIPLIENDYRVSLSPKVESSFKTHSYIQTFQEKFGFQNNLSILDLLFNEGPNSISIIEESEG